MRKYFKKHVYSKRSRRTPIQGVSPWELLGVFVQGTASVIGFDTLCDFFSVCRKKSVSELNRCIANVESELQQYSGSNLDYVYAARQLCAFLKKYPFESSDLAITPRDNAIAKFLECENKCQMTNDRLRSCTEVPSWVLRAKSLISKVLGKLEPSVVMSIITDGAHGPGSTLSNNGKRVTEYYKYADFPYTVTKSSSMYALAAISANPRWMDILEGTGRRSFLPLPSTPQYQKELQIFWDCTELAELDSITFVPKDAKIERPIAVGASLNLFLQLGVKSYMEERLKRFGVDLTSQEKNREFARLGSLNDSPSGFVTIDLSSASDTISFELVKLLLDPMWFAFLDDLRHKAGKLGDKVITYQKFSAMGNGFTFPLESLIFWAVQKAASEDAGYQCTSNDCAVFGDDIIVRKRCYTIVKQALEWCGFSVNTDKSFISGPFRESCGKDYYSGSDVRPFYLKRPLQRYEDIYFVLNSIATLSISRGRSFRFLNDLYEFLYRRLDPDLINFLPMEDSSDGGICVPLEYLRSVGVNPWLSSSELSQLGIPYPGAPVCAVTVSRYSSREFRGKERVKLLIALKGEARVIPEFLRKEHGSLEVLSRYSVTRRDSVTEAVRVYITSAWNGVFTFHQLGHHPLNFFKRC